MGVDDSIPPVTIKRVRFPVLLLAVAFLAAAQAIPALPDLAFDSFPPAAREGIGRAHARAAARPRDAEAAGELGRLLHAWEQWESAHQAYARAQALAPDAFAWHYLDGVVLQRLVRHDEAAGRFRRALEIDAGYLAARVKLAEALLEMGRLDESRPLFEGLVEEAAAEPAARVGLGRIAAREGRTAEAIAHLERAVALFPQLGEAHYALARAYRAAGRAADAEAALRKHQEYGPRWPALEDPVLAGVSTRREDARALVQRGVALARSGDLQDAIAAHEAALARDPALLHARGNLVSLYGQARNYDKVEEHYRAALQGGYDGADLHYDYAVVLGLQERWEEAEAAYRRALTINPLHANARNNLGQLLERKRDLGGAATEYRLAAEAQPSFRLARFNLGRMLMALGRSAEAVSVFEGLQQPVDAETPRYAFALATALVRAGAIDRGLALARDAQRMAAEQGQPELAAAIARELERAK